VKSALIATDFSTEAGHAVRRASAIARETGLAGELVHVLPDSLPPELHVLAATRAQEALAAVAEQCHAEGASFGIRLLSGSVGDELAVAARGHDLAIAGARGEDLLLYHFALGRTSVRLVQESERPVLVVKRAVQRPYRRVVAAVDFSGASRAAVGLAARLAPNAQFELAHAYEVMFESTLRRAGTGEETIEGYRIEANARALAAMTAFAASLPIPPERLSTFVVRGYPPRVVLDRAEGAADLVVLGKRSTGPVERFLLGSVALQVLELAPCDVLIVPEAPA
jgi:CPA2 family monovalent cation:H+ antiporter-2